MKLYIKFMVSHRCKMKVKEELTKLKLHYLKVKLGEVALKEAITAKNRALFKLALSKSGLVLMDDKKAMLIEKIKNVIIMMIHHTEVLPQVNFSTHLSNQLAYDYTYLSNLFSETEGNTIEHFILLHKIEKIKELIIYDELNLTEIAYKLQYSSIGALSNQFKKVTGLTPSFYKTLKNKRKNLEDI